MKLCSILLILFCLNAKNDKFGYLTPFGKVRANARPWLMACWKAHGRLSIYVNWTFFRYLLRFRSYKAKCVQLGVFAGGWPLCIRILPGQGRSPSTILGNRKLETIEDKVIKTRWWRPHPSGFPHFDTILECDGQTDRQTEGRTDFN